MTINSISTNISSQAIQQSSRPPASNGLRGGQGQSGAPDLAAVAQVNATNPTTNTSGQTIGTTISITA